MNDNPIDPSKFKKSKAKNKALMKGKKRKQTQRIYKAGPRDIGRNDDWNPKPFKTATKQSKNKVIFNSFDRNMNRRNQQQKNDQRRSVRVTLNKQNKAKRNAKHTTGKKTQSERRSTVKLPKNKRNGYTSDSRKMSDATVKKVRFEAHQSINYEEFVPYDPNESDDIKSKEDEHSPRNRHYSATNESEKELDLDDDYDDEQMMINAEELEQMDDLFEIDEDFEMRKGNRSPSGHDHIYNGHGYNVSMSGHDHLFNDLFDVDQTADDDIYNITASVFKFDDDGKENESEIVTRKRRASPPNRPLPSMKRVRGIKEYSGKWKVSFDGMTPKVETNRSSVSKRRKRTMSKSKKYKEPSSSSTYSYSIYKDGSVQVAPKNAFGWNGNAQLSFDDNTNRYKIHTTADSDYEYIQKDNDGMLLIEHFIISSGSIKTIIGTGVRC